MTKLNVFVLALIAAIATSASAQNQAQPGQAQQQPRSADDRLNQGMQKAADGMKDAARDMKEAMPGMQDGDKMFIQGIASANQLEIKLGEIIQEKSTDDQARKYAQAVAQDHQENADKIRQVGQKIGVSVTDELHPIHQAIFEHVQTLPADMLGRKYIFNEVGGHQTGLLELQYQAANARSTDVRQLAEALMPNCRDHLEQARQIAATEMARTAGERIPANAPADPDKPAPGGTMDRGTDTGTGSGTGLNPTGPDRGTGSGAGSSGSGTGAGTTDR